jgi:hypothetical protein
MVRSFPAPAAVAGYRSVAQGAALGAQEAPWLGLAGGVRARGAGKVRDLCAVVVGVARRSKTDAGRSDGDAGVWRSVGALHRACQMRVVATASLAMARRARRPWLPVEQRRRQFATGIWHVFGMRPKGSD